MIVTELTGVFTIVHITKMLVFPAQVTIDYIKISYVGTM